MIQTQRYLIVIAVMAGFFLWKAPQNIKSKDKSLTAIMAFCVYQSIGYTVSIESLPISKSLTINPLIIQVVGWAFVIQAKICLVKFFTPISSNAITYVPKILWQTGLLFWSLCMIGYILNAPRNSVVFDLHNRWMIFFLLAEKPFVLLAYYEALRKCPALIAGAASHIKISLYIVFVGLALVAANDAIFTVLLLEEGFTGHHYALISDLSLQAYFVGFVVLVIGLAWYGIRVRARIITYTMKALKQLPALRHMHQSLSTYTIYTQGVSVHNKLSILSWHYYYLIRNRDALLVISSHIPSGEKCSTQDEEINFHAGTIAELLEKKSTQETSTYPHALPFLSTPSTVLEEGEFMAKLWNRIEQHKILLSLQKIG